jgi:hypothetical protein
VDVVKTNHHRAGGRQALEQVAQRPVRPVPIANRRSRESASLGRRHRQSRGQPGERVRVGQAQQPDPAFTQRGQVPIDGLAPERVRQIAFELRRACAQHLTILAAGEPRQLEQQPCFADPGLTDDHCHAARPATQRHERDGELPALARAPD